MHALSRKYPVQRARYGLICIYLEQRSSRHCRVTVNVAIKRTLHTKSGVIVPENALESVVVTRTDFRCDYAGPRSLTALQALFCLCIRPIVRI